MLILLQLLVMAAAIVLRGRYYFGWHLRADKANPGALVRRSRGKRKRITRLDIGVARDNGILFQIKRESGWHRFLKKIGLAQEFHIRRASFDRAFFIATDTPSHLQDIIKTEGLVEALEALFLLPVKRLYATPTRVWCVIERADLQCPDSYFDRHRALLGIVATKTQHPTLRHGSAGLSRRSFAFATIALHAGILVAAIGGWASTTLGDDVHIIDRAQWFATSAGLGLMGLAAWLGAILIVLRGSSWIGFVLFDFLVVAIPGFMIGSPVLIREANIRLAQSPPTELRQTVLSKSCTLKCRKSCGRRCTRRSHYTYSGDEACTPNERVAQKIRRQAEDSICASKAIWVYDIDVQPWPGRHNIYSFSPDDIRFDRFSTGEKLTIPLSRGALGIGWIDHDSIAP